MAEADDRLYDFQLPDLGEGVMEGEMVKWLVQPGQQISADQPLLQIMTDKATVEIPSPRKGTVKQHYIGEGDIIPVGAKMLQIELAPGESRPPVIQHGPGAAAPAQVTPSAPSARTAPSPPPAPPAPSAPLAAQAPAPAVATARDGREGAGTAVLAPERKPLATPAVRQLARDLDIDLAQVPGSGPGGRVTREDIEAASRRPAAAPARPPVRRAEPTFAPGEREQRHPIRGLRRKIAEKMVQSAFTAVHVTQIDECDMTSLSAVRLKVRKAAEEHGVKISYMPFIIKAIVAALKQFPRFNASWDQETGEIVLKGYYHIGFGVATDQGLLVGVIKDADQKSVVDLARETQEIAGRIREGKATIDELTGSTFTITNFGSLGGLFATPIINHPEVAILGLGKIEKRAVVRDDQIVARDMMYLGVTFDHRIVDGADAVHFSNTLIAYLQTPELLMLEMA